ncbi:unnamed protein product [Pylaiella littoralis]
MCCPSSPPARAHARSGLPTATSSKPSPAATRLRPPFSESQAPLP